MRAMILLGLALALSACAYAEGGDRDTNCIHQGKAHIVQCF